MPRTSNRKRNNNRRNESTVRVTSNLSPNAPEFIPTANETTANQREHFVIQSMTFCGSSSASNSSGNHSNSNSEAPRTISSIPDALKNKGQRDLLINLLNECKVDCVICYEQAKNVEQIWNCRNCYQIMHLKCIIVWFIKSHCNAVWRCPACQSEVTGKPKYVCFCGTLPNPYHNSVDTPHSCGQVCGLQRKNSNLNYNDCHHKCTLLCHPGPCPQCVVQVKRSCGCGKKQVYAQCGQSTQILCDKACHKKLNCQIHQCEKMCHANNCEPCNKGCPQNLILPEASLNASNATFAEAILQYNLLPPESVVTMEELRMLGLSPEEIFEPRNVLDSYYSTSSNYNIVHFAPMYNSLFNPDDSEYDENGHSVRNEGSESRHFVHRRNLPSVVNPLSSGSHGEFDIEYSTSDDGEDYEEDDFEEADDNDDDEGDDGDDDDDHTEACVSNDSSNALEFDPNLSWGNNSSNDEEREIGHPYSPTYSEQSGDNLWDMSDPSADEVEGNAGNSSLYSEDSTDSSSQSGISSSNSNSNSTASTSSCSSSSTSTSSSSSF